MDVPGLAHLLIISDAAINIATDLEAKVERPASRSGQRC
jgi:hypothetical protein